jgi:hypothetical protein
MKREEAIYCLKAQSERYSEVCEECPLYGQTGVDHCCEDALQMAITALQNQPFWIPVIERLPEEPEENEIFDNKPLELYLVSIKGDPYPFRAFWNGKFFTNGWQKCEVTAWIPLPETYRESEVEYGK